jgi:hypothetical protein
MKRLHLWISTVLLAFLSACNYSVGECWIQGEDGAGSGTISGTGGGGVPPGGGDFGTTPPKQPQDATNPSEPVCNSMGSYDASLFKFKTTVADDGADAAGGYQVASAVVKFIDGRQDPPAVWWCSLTVQMPLRTEIYGKISPGAAADMTADVLTDASSFTMHKKSEWIQALFCKTLAKDMTKLFNDRYKGVGPTISAQ